MNKGRCWCCAAAWGSIIATVTLLFYAGWFAHAGVYWAATTCGLFGGAAVIAFAGALFFIFFD